MTHPNAALPKPPSSPAAADATLATGRPSLAHDAQIIVHCERANFAQATRLILNRFSGEVRAFLRARTKNRASMEEVYSVFSEDVWRGLPQYRFQGRVRSWLYVLARNALSRHIKSKRRWISRHESAELDELQVEVRHSISAGSGDLSRLEPLLAKLSFADRRLLEQRLVLSLAWREIAIERLRERGDSNETLIARESARLRKRYQMLVASLRARSASEPEG